MWPSDGWRRLYRAAKDILAFSGPCDWGYEALYCVGTEFLVVLKNALDEVDREFKRLDDDTEKEMQRNV